jgi:hypothetical protein
MSDKTDKFIRETIIWTLEEDNKKKDAEIEKLRTALEDAANGFEVNGLYTRANKIYKVLDKA